MEVYKQKMAEYDAWVTSGSRGVKLEKPTQPKEVDTLHDAYTLGPAYERD